MKKIKQIHTWLSIPFGIFIFILCFSGAILALEPARDLGEERTAFFKFFFKLHRWLLDPANPKGEGIKIGKTLVGISTLAFAGILISGITLWWQRARRNLKRSLTITRKYGTFPFIRQLHVAGGAYITIFLLIMALTGLCWSFGWYRDGFLSIFGLEPGRTSMGIIRRIHTGDIGGVLTRTIWFFAALLGTTLPISGYYLFFRRRNRR